MVIGHCCKFLIRFSFLCIVVLNFGPVGTVSLVQLRLSPEYARFVNSDKPPSDTSTPLQCRKASSTGQCQPLRSMTDKPSTRGAANVKRFPYFILWLQDLYLHFGSGRLFRGSFLPAARNVQLSTTLDESPQSAKYPYRFCYCRWLNRFPEICLFT